MTNYDGGYDDRNEDVNDDLMPLPDQDLMVPYSIQSQGLGLMEEDREKMVIELCQWRTMYICVRLYIYPIKTILKMHAKIGVLDLCC